MQSLVAQASATAGSSAKTVTASATPNETDGPTVAEEVQQPRTPSPGGRTNAYRSEYGEQPAWTPTRSGRSAAYAMSPPFSTTPKRAPASTMASTPAAAMAPATAAMGPTPASSAARTMRRTTGPASPGVVRLERGEEEGVAGGHALDLGPGAKDGGLRGGEVGRLLREEGRVGLAEVEPLAEHQSWSESAPCGQASWHLPQRTQRPSSTTSCQSRVEREDVLGADRDAGPAVHALVPVVEDCAVEPVRGRAEGLHPLAHELAGLVRHLDQGLALVRVDLRPLDVDQHARVAHDLRDHRLPPLLPRERHKEFHFRPLPISFDRFVPVSIPTTRRSPSTTGSALMLFRSSFWAAMSTGSSAVVVTTRFVITSATLFAFSGRSTAFEMSKVVMTPESRPSASSTTRWFVSPRRSLRGRGRHGLVDRDRDRAPVHDVPHPRRLPGLAHGPGGLRRVHAAGREGEGHLPRGHPLGQDGRDLPGHAEGRERGGRHLLAVELDMARAEVGVRDALQRGPPPARDPVVDHVDRDVGVGDGRRADGLEVQDRDWHPDPDVERDAVAVHGRGAEVLGLHRLQVARDHQRAEAAGRRGLGPLAHDHPLGPAQEDSGRPGR